MISINSSNVPRLCQLQEYTTFNKNSNLHLDPISRKNGYHKDKLIIFRAYLKVKYSLSHLICTQDSTLVWIWLLFWASLASLSPRFRVFQAIISCIQKKGKELELCRIHKLNATSHKAKDNNIWPNLCTYCMARLLWCLMPTWCHCCAVFKQFLIWNSPSIKVNQHNNAIDVDQIGLLMFQPLPLSKNATGTITIWYY